MPKTLRKTLKRTTLKKGGDNRIRNDGKTIEYIAYNPLERFKNLGRVKSQEKFLNKVYDIIKTHYPYNNGNELQPLTKDNIFNIYALDTKERRRQLMERSGLYPSDTFGRKLILEEIDRYNELLQYRVNKENKNIIKGEVKIMKEEKDKYDEDDETKTEITEPFTEETSSVYSEEIKGGKRKANKTRKLRKSKV